MPIEIKTYGHDFAAQAMQRPTRQLMTGAVLERPPYARHHEPNGQHDHVMAEHADEVQGLAQTIIVLGMRQTPGITVEIVEAAMAIWLTEALGVAGPLLATTILTDGEVATDTLGSEGLA